MVHVVFFMAVMVGMPCLKEEESDAVTCSFVRVLLGMVAPNYSANWVLRVAEPVAQEGHQGR